MDVSNGTDNTTLPTKRLKRVAKVTSVDFAPSLLIIVKGKASLVEEKDNGMQGRKYKNFLLTMSNLMWIRWVQEYNIII